ncbi:MAG: AAA family ATPase [Actinomycetota bacterium]|nr:AAA family ATPase [Actinomycetota bacterium]
MRLVTVRVRDYKSITDSGDVPVEDAVTCLVGKNESGKSAFLEALYRLNPLPSGHPTKFRGIRDFPRNRWARERANVEEKIPVSATFDLEDADVGAIEQQLGTGSVRSRSVTVSRKYDNALTVAGLEIDESAVVRHQVAYYEAPAELAKDVSTLAELNSNIDAMADRPPSVEKLLDDLDFVPWQTAWRAIQARMPRFLYFDEYNELPGRLSIPALQAADEDDLDTGQRTALALLRLAGVESAEFTEADYEERRAALEAAGSEITQEVFRYWSQNQDLRVIFDVDFKTPATDSAQQPPWLDIRIENRRHYVTLNFGERSAGFVWFFSFLAAFSEYREHGQQLVLLLDEPGMGLHASAQADLLKYIDERLAPDHQVLYTTHSPFMVDAAQLGRARIVEDRDEIGTKVSAEVLGTSRETLFPLQAALGYELTQTLFIGEDNLVVEGPSDYVYLTVVSDQLKANGRVGLDERWTIVPVGGLDKVPTFIALLGAHLSLTVLMDGKAGGSQKINDQVRKGVVDAQRVIALAEITDSSQADIEDVFDETFYLKLVRSSGAARVAKKDLAAGDRITQRIEAALGERYDHYRPARHLLSNTALASELDDETLSRFERLFERLNATLPVTSSAKTAP